MKTNAKTLKGFLSILALTFIVLLTGFMLMGCGETRSTYVFETDMPTEITSGEIYNFNVTLKAQTIREQGYDNVRIFIELDNSEDLEIVAIRDDGQEIDISQVGTWGPAEGFTLTPDYNETTSVRLCVKEPGNFKVTLKLVDLDNDTVIIEDTNTYTVA